MAHLRYLFEARMWLSVSTMRSHQMVTFFVHSIFSIITYWKYISVFRLKIDWILFYWIQCIVPALNSYQIPDTSMRPKLRQWWWIPCVKVVWLVFSQSILFFLDVTTELLTECCVQQGSPTLLPKSDCPADLSSNPAPAHLSAIIKPPWTPH